MAEGIFCTSKQEAPQRDTIHPSRVLPCVSLHGPLPLIPLSETFLAQQRTHLVSSQSAPAERIAGDFLLERALLSRNTQIIHLNSNFQYDRIAFLQYTLGTLTHRRRSAIFPPAYVCFKNSSHKCL